MTKNGNAVSAANLSTYLSAHSSVSKNTLVTFTPDALATGAANDTYVITSTCSGSGSDSVTITVTEPLVEFKHSSTKSDVSYGGNGTKESMTYDPTASTTLSSYVYSLTLNSVSANSNNYWVIWDGYNGHNYYYGTTINSNSGYVGGTAYQAVESDNSDKAGNVKSTYAGNIKVYYDITNQKFYAELPIRVRYYGRCVAQSKDVSTSQYVNYAYGATATNTKTVTATGYTQTSTTAWYTNTACNAAYAFPALTGNQTLVTLYTPMTANTYTVTLDAATNGGSNGASFTHTYGVASSLSSYVATPPTGYSFDGWFEATSGGSAVDTVAANAITENKTYYAQYSEIKATGITAAMTTDGAADNSKTGGSITISGGSAVASGSLSATGVTTSQTLTAAASTGHTFTGWTVTGTNAGNIRIKDNSDNVLWNGTSWVGSATTTPIKVYTDGSGTSLDATITATFTTNTHAYTISTATRSASSGNFTPDNNVPAAAIAGSTASNASMAYGTALTRTGFSVPGYKFIGFYANLDGTGTPVNAMPDSDYTVYACFEKGVNVTFVDAATPGGGATLKASTFTYYNTAAAAPASDPSHTGYTFTGWSDGTNTYATANLPVLTGTADVTYTATYSHNVYTVNTSVRYTDNGTDYTIDATGAVGTLTASNNNGSGTYYYLDKITVAASVTFPATQLKGYYIQSIEMCTNGTDWTTVTTDVDSPTYTTAAMQNDSFTLQDGYTNDTISFRVNLRAYYFITAYSSWVWNERIDDYEKVAAPPKTITVGPVGGEDRARYSFAIGDLEDCGEDDHYYQSIQATPGEITTHIISGASGSYHEGNKILVYAGEQVVLHYSSLGSSEAIRGVFYNNNIRFTTEEELSDLYTNREWQGWHLEGEKRVGDGVDDGWGTSKVPYTYTADTTLDAVAAYYTGETADTISGQRYVATFDQVEHTVTWIVTQSYMNIDTELASKKKVTVNGDDLTGIVLTGRNPEGYYFPGETVGTTLDDTDDGFKIALGTSSTCTYSFSKLASELTMPTGFSIKAYNSSNTEETTTAANISYYIVTGTMGESEVDLTIDVKTEYLMKLTNVVVSDKVDKKMMATQTSQKTYGTGSGSTGESSGTGYVGTITAIVNDGSDTNIASDGSYHWLYPDNGNIYENNDANNNYYLKQAGVNKTGSLVEKGRTVTYTFNFNETEGMNGKYSFVGWFEGSFDGDSFSVKYNKKLGGKTTLSHTPKANMTVVAVVTRDIYLGGTFNSSGVYKSDSDASEQTWNSNRIKMEFDASYSDSNNTGRYYYEFKTVTANTEYQFRCYDADGTGAAGQKDTNLTVWNTWSADNGGYNTAADNAGIAYYRDKYENNQTCLSDVGFMYTTATGQHITQARSGGGATPSATYEITVSHLAQGYEAPVYVYFYPSDGGATVESSYQWARAYVSAGVGVDVTNADAILEAYAHNALPENAEDQDAIPGTSFNTPLVKVDATTPATAKTAGSAEVEGYNSDVTIGCEHVISCRVKEKNGAIRVTATPKDDNLDVQAFVVYDIDKRTATAVTGSDIKAAPDWSVTVEGVTTNYKAFYADIAIPVQSNVYIVPVYKFTDAYMSDPAHDNMDEHTVYVDTTDLNIDTWGGLVSMYSWGSTAGFSSGYYPGQLLIPDGQNGFYGQLQYLKGGLAGVVFTNYNPTGESRGFLYYYWDKKPDGTAASSDNERISTTGYCDNRANVQTYDYREPIAILENIGNEVYTSDDMSLYFSLKQGNKSGTEIGTESYSAAYDWQYLTDRTGTKRVDLNGNVADGSYTYNVVCWYTQGYTGDTPAQTYAHAESTRNEHSINWTVYDSTGTKVAGGDNYLSASFIDGNLDGKSFTTVIAEAVMAAGQPVSGKTVRIAYEQPKNEGETIRYSGQWYAESANTLIDVDVNIGVYSDGVYTPSDSTDAGYARGTVALVAGTFAEPDEVFSTPGKAKVTTKHANGKVALTVSTTDNFVGWYTYDEASGDYNKYSEDQTITPVFKEDTTYYAFYNASATYVFTYTDRSGNPKIFSVAGSDLDGPELASGALNTTTRSEEIAAAATKAGDIAVFNRRIVFSTETPTSNTNYTLTYAATTNAVESNSLNVYSYRTGSLALTGTISGAWNTPLNVTENVSLGNGTALTIYKPSTAPDSVFIGWVEYDGSTAPSITDKILSTKPNFGYSVTRNTSIAPLFGTVGQRDDIYNNTWSADIDKNGISTELTSDNNGYLYNDTLISFRFSSNTDAVLDPTGGNNCGVVILAQEGASAESYGGTFTNESNANYLSDTKMKAYAEYLVSRPTTSSARLNSSKFGTTYALQVQVDSLSSMNRVNIAQALPYSNFKGGNYKVIAYYYDGENYVYSDVVTGTYTNGTKFPVTAP